MSSGVARRGRLGSAVALLAIVGGAAGCVPTPATAEGREVASLYMLFLGAAAVVAAIVVGSTTWAIFRYPRRTDALPHQTYGNTRLEAASIRLYSDLAANSVSAFSRIEATGGVFVESAGQSVSGTTAVVNMTARTIVVSGEVVLSQGGNVLTGSRLLVDLSTGRARLEGGKVRGLFTPGSPTIGQ